MAAAWPNYNLPIAAGLFFTLIAIVAIWDAVWKGFALWRAGRNGQPVWFIFLLIVNSAGILPIVYLLFFGKKREASARVELNLAE